MKYFSLDGIRTSSCTATSPDNCATTALQPKRAELLRAYFSRFDSPPPTANCIGQCHGEFNSDGGLIVHPTLIRLLPSGGPNQVQTIVTVGSLAKIANIFQSSSSSNSDCYWLALFVKVQGQKRLHKDSIWTNAVKIRPNSVQIRSKERH